MCNARSILMHCFKSSRAVKHNLQICRTSKSPVNFLNSALMFGPTMSREKDMQSLQMLFSRMAYCKVSGARTTTRFQYNWPCV